MHQPLSEPDEAIWVDLYDNFRMFLEDNSAMRRSRWFSGEVYFHLNGHVCKQNMHAWASEHVHNIMKTPLHQKNAQYGLVCHQVVLPDLFFSAVLRLLFIISIPSKKKFFHFSRVWVSTSKKDFWHTPWMQFWMYWMSILITKCCLIISLNGSDMGGHGHHTP